MSCNVSAVVHGDRAELVIGIGHVGFLQEAFQRLRIPALLSKDLTEIGPGPSLRAQSDGFPEIGFSARQVAGQVP